MAVESGFDIKVTMRVVSRRETLSDGSAALATIILCSPSDPITNPTDETIVAVTVRFPCAAPDVPMWTMLGC